MLLPKQSEQKVLICPAKNNLIYSAGYHSLPSWKHSFQTALPYSVSLAGIFLHPLVMKNLEK